MLLPRIFPKCLKKLVSDVPTWMLVQRSVIDLFVPPLGIIGKRERIRRSPYELVVDNCPRLDQSYIRNLRPSAGSTEPHQ